MSRLGRFGIIRLFVVLVLVALAGAERVARGALAPGRQHRPDRRLRLQPQDDHGPGRRVRHVDQHRPGASHRDLDDGRV